MNLPDVLENLNDPELGGGVAFQVKRTVNTRAMGNVTQETEYLNVTGNIQPQTKSSQASTPEDPRTEEIVIYAAFEFQLGANDGDKFTGPDEILFNGNTYRVTRVNNWSDWGFSIAYAERVMG